MRVSKTLRLLLTALLALAVCVGIVGCSAEKRTATKLHGTWYEDQTGQPYDFISATQLVLPQPLDNGSNAVTYHIVDGDKISMTQSGVIHVIDITKLDRNELDTYDSAASATSKYFRSLDDTTWGKTRAKAESEALPALKRFPSIVAKPDIAWVSAEPTDSADAWKKWPTSSIQRYAKAWNWSDIKRNPRYSLVTSGAAGTEGFAVDFTRVVPTDQQISAYEQSTGQSVSAGLPYIAVGYSASMAQYPAGTLIYLNNQLLYSLGDGFVIGVDTGATKADGFTPTTHE